MRLTREGKLIKITRGLYEDDPEVNPSYLAIQIYNPSYLSFDYALYIYNLIPEAVYVYTSATFGKRKTKTFINRFGTYTFRDIPKAAFPYGVIAKTDGEYSYHIAAPEKALCDKLYTISPAKNMKEFEYLLFEDLRIDEEDFWSLNKDDIQFVSPLYHSTNLDFLTKLLNPRQLYHPGPETRAGCSQSAAWMECHRQTGNGACGENTHVQAFRLA